MIVNILAIFLIVLSVLCFGYFFAIVSYSGIDTAFLWFWLALGVACMLSSMWLTYTHNHKTPINKYISFAFLFFIIVGMSIFAIVEGMIVHKGNSSPDKNADYVIILGAQVKGMDLSKVLKSRLDIAVTYLNDNPESTVIVSGGQGKGEEISEALAMKNYLLSVGIKDSRIIMEDKSTNTKENIGFSHSIIAHKDKKTVIVTNKFHLFRAIMIAKKQGMTNVTGLGASNDDILAIHYYIREFFALIKDKLVGNI